MRVLVTGSTGLVGGTLVPRLRETDMDVVAHGLSKPCQVNADLTDRDATESLLDKVQPDAIINLVALTDVDTSEKDPDLAYRLNVLTVENLAAWIGLNPGRRLVQLSTDQVYDGLGTHGEDDVTIRNTYAMTKYAGELAAFRVGGIALRTNLFGRSRTEGRKSLSDWLLDSFRARKPITLMTDVMFSPLALPTLVEMIILTLNGDARGVFNLGSRDGMSKRDFALALARHFDLPTDNARDGTQADLNLSAVRPTGMLMDSTRFEKTFGLTLPTLSEEIPKAEV